MSVFVLLNDFINFWKHKTTVNPSKLKDTSSLITSGVFAFSRNPIYVIDALLLLSWAVWLGQWLNLVMPFVFIWYCTEFQIKAEESVLAEKFGDQFEQYKNAGSTMALVGRSPYNYF